MMILNFTYIGQFTENAVKYEIRRIDRQGDKESKQRCLKARHIRTDCNYADVNLCGIVFAKAFEKIAFQLKKRGFILFEWNTIAHKMI